MEVEIIKNSIRSLSCKQVLALMFVLTLCANGLGGEAKDLFKCEMCGGRVGIDCCCMRKADEAAECQKARQVLLTSPYSPYRGDEKSVKGFTCQEAKNFARPYGFKTQDDMKFEATEQLAHARFEADFETRREKSDADIRAMQEKFKEDLKSRDAKRNAKDDRANSPENAKEFFKRATTEVEKAEKRNGVRPADPQASADREEDGPNSAAFPRSDPVITGGERGANPSDNWKPSGSMPDAEPNADSRRRAAALEEILGNIELPNSGTPSSNAGNPFAGAIRPLPPAGIVGGGNAPQSRSNSSDQSAGDRAEQPPAEAALHSSITDGMAKADSLRVQYDSLLTQIHGGDDSVLTREKLTSTSEKLVAIYREIASPVQAEVSATIDRVNREATAGVGNDDPTYLNSKIASIQRGVDALKGEADIDLHVGMPPVYAAVQSLIGARETEIAFLRSVAEGNPIPADQINKIANINGALNPRVSTTPSGSDLNQKP